MKNSPAACLSTGEAYIVGLHGFIIAFGIGVLVLAYDHRVMVLPQIKRDGFVFRRLLRKRFLKRKVLIGIKADACMTVYFYRHMLYEEQECGYTNLRRVIQRMVDYAKHLIVLLAREIHGAEHQVGQQEQHHAYGH